MKALLLCLLLLAGCTTPAPPPEPPPAPVVVGHFIVTEYDVNGRPTRTWETSSFRETQFPRSVTFDDGTQLVTLHGSYQIRQSLK